VDGYRVERSTDNVTFGVAATLGSTATSYADTGRSQGVTYYYRVQAYNGGGSSGYSNTVNVAVPPAAPAAPTGLAFTISGTTVNLNWIASGSGTVDGYRVERSTDNVTFGLAANMGSTATSYADTGRAPRPDVLLSRPCLQHRRVLGSVQHRHRRDPAERPDGHLPQ
jgi:fibronectin type 3 domain-containing protein